LTRIREITPIYALSTIGVTSTPTATVLEKQRSPETMTITLIGLRVLFIVMDLHGQTMIMTEHHDIREIIYTLSACSITSTREDMCEMCQVHPCVLVLSR
jgi:hypothetical protein